MAAVRTKVERTAQCRSAAAEDLCQHFALAGRHGGAEASEVGRSPTPKDLVNAAACQAVDGDGLAHGRAGPLEVTHQAVQTLLVLRLTEGSQMGIPGSH